MNRSDLTMGIILWVGAAVVFGVVFVGMTTWGSVDMNTAAAIAWIIAVGVIVAGNAINFWRRMNK